MTDAPINLADVRQARGMAPPPRFTAGDPVHFMEERTTVQKRRLHDGRWQVLVFAYGASRWLNQDLVEAAL